MLVAGNRAPGQPSAARGCASSRERASLARRCGCAQAVLCCACHRRGRSPTPPFRLCGWLRWLRWRRNTSRSSRSRGPRGSRAAMTDANAPFIMEEEEAPFLVSCVPDTGAAAGHRHSQRCRCMNRLIERQRDRPTVATVLLMCC